MTSPWRQLSGLDGYRITEIPRRADGEATARSGADERDPGRAQRFAALVAAYHVGDVVAFGWMRHRTGGDVHILAAGSALAGSTPTGGTAPGSDVVLALPGGARARVLGPGALARAMSELACWRAIGGISDGLLVSARDAPPDRDQAVPSLEECLLPAWTGPFGWMVVVEPVGPADVGGLADEVAGREYLATGMADRFPERDVEARRLRHRHTELRQGLSTGLWRVHLLAGAADPVSAARVAGLVCASADLRGLPYALAPVRADTTGLTRLLAGHSAEAPAEGNGLADTQPTDAVTHPADALACPSDALDQSAEAANGREPEARWPFYASTELLAALARAPESEIPGVRLALQPDFDVTPETAALTLGDRTRHGTPHATPDATADATPDATTPDATTPDATTPDATTPRAVTLGQVLDRQRMPAGGLDIPLSSLNRHVFVCGATGGGKSQTVRGLLEAATKAGVPWLVVEPAKAEYRLMAGRLADSGRPASDTAQVPDSRRPASDTAQLADSRRPAADTARLARPDTQIIRIRPGEADAIAAGLNPLEPAADGAGHRFPLQTHADLVRALFLAAFQSEEPFPQVLSAALTQVYEETGWDLALGEPVSEGVAPGYPSLSDLQRTAEKVVLDIGYSDMVSADVLGFIKVRLSSLRLGTTGRFLEGGHPVDFGQLLRRNAILEIEDVGDDRDKAFLMGTVLIRLVEHLRLARRHQTGPEPGLRHLTVFEEAHRLLRRPDRDGGAAAHAVELFAGLLAEIRAYGEGIVIAEQIPAKLIPDIIKNTAVKIAHRLPAADDREAVGATMNLTAAQSQYLVTLVPGEAAVSIDGMDRPVLARMPDGTAREVAAFTRAGGAVPGAPATDGNDMPGLAGLVGPAAVTSPRSITCGADCAARPCTLRDMRSAQRALERNLGVVLWAELAVLAHLTGWPTPIPQVPLLDLLRAMPARLRDCALSHAVDAAVASRTPVISAQVSPIGLASHVGDAMRGRLVSGTSTCEKDEPQWLAPASPGAQRAVAFGLATPSAIERATGASVTDEDFQPQVAGHLEQFVDCRWPLLYLTGTPSDAPAK